MYGQVLKHFSALLFLFTSPEVAQMSQISLLTSVFVYVGISRLNSVIVLHNLFSAAFLHNFGLHNLFSASFLHNYGVHNLFSSSYRYVLHNVFHGLF